MRHSSGKRNRTAIAANLIAQSLLPERKLLILFLGEKLHAMWVAAMYCTVRVYVRTTSRNQPDEPLPVATH